MGIRIDPKFDNYNQDPGWVYIVVDDKGRPRTVWFDEDEALKALKSDDEASTYIEMECG